MKWYIKKGIPFDIDRFILRTQDTDDWKEDTITQEQVVTLLSEKLRFVDYDIIKEDLVWFIPDDSVMDIWGKYIKNLKFQEL